MAAAITYVAGIGMANVRRHDSDLLAQAVTSLQTLPRLRLVGRPKERVGVVSFVVDGIHAHDLGTILDHHGVAIRTGQHCAEPLMRRLGVAATARASFALYNDLDDVEHLVHAIGKACEVFSA